MSWLAQKGRSIYRQVRTWGGWLKNFGVENTLFMVKIDNERKKDIYGMWKPSDRVLQRVQREYKKRKTEIQIISVPIDCNRAKEWNQVIQKSNAKYYLCKTDDVELSKLALWALAEKICSNPKNEGKVLYSDQCIDTEFIYKPSFGIDTLLAQNYIGGMLCISRDVWEKLGGFQEELPQAALYDFVLRTYEQYGELTIGHVEKAIFQQKELEDDSCKHIVQEQEMQAIREYLMRRDKLAEVSAIARRLYQITYAIQENFKVSIIIPNKDNVAILRQCVDSIIKKSTYSNYEIVIVENNSVEQETFDYYSKIEQSHADIIKVVTCVTDWNYSYINNFGVRYADGDFLILLNNDTEVITADWIEQMLQYAQQQEVGIVGAKLLYPDGTIQHGGVTLGIRGVAGHAFHGWSGNSTGYMNRLITVQNLTAVTAACLMISRKVFEQVGGLDERFKVAFNDTDLCMRVRKEDYRVVFNPRACLYHHESKSRGTDEQSPEKLNRFNGESMRFQRIYCKELALGDPYYNFNLQKNNDDFMIANWE